MFCSSSVGAAVPIGISLNICLESAFIITVSNCFATSIHNAVLPTPVGPTMTISVFMDLPYDASLRIFNEVYDVIDILALGNALTDFFYTFFKHALGI